MNNDRTTLVCLFHHPRQAEAALGDLSRAGVPSSAISVIGNRPGGLSGVEGGQADFRSVTLSELGVPERDLGHLSAGVQEGGTVLAVYASPDHVSAVEHVFDRNLATVIDEAEVRDTVVAPPVAPLAAATVATSIPIVEEELAVGKRSVDRGGVRVYRRVVEIPAEESVSLRDEHVHIDRHPVDRSVTQQDLAMQGDQTIELTETSEEAVVSKSAHVIEELRVSKDAVEHTEMVHETLRHTEVEVEQLSPDSSAAALRSGDVLANAGSSSHSTGVPSSEGSNITRGGN